MLPFLLYWMSPLPPHHPFLKPPQPWPLPLPSCFPQDPQWPFTCYLNARFPPSSVFLWIWSPFWRCSAPLASISLLFLLSFHCQFLLLHIPPKPKDQFSVLFSSLYIMLFESQYFLCTPCSWHSLSTTPKYIYGKVTFHCAREMITKQTSREGSSGRTSWHHDIWARHRWWKRTRQQSPSGKKGRGQSKCKGPEIETKVAFSRERKKKTAWLEPGEQRGEWKKGQMERLTPPWNVILLQSLVILLLFYLVMALSVSPTTAISSEKNEILLVFLFLPALDQQIIKLVAFQWG